MSNIIKPNLFVDFASINQLNVPKELQTKFIDSVISSMEKQKDDGVSSESVKGLTVKIKASHAARLTGHYHYYAPAKVDKGARTFIEPFNKPVLTHHDVYRDPIGRVNVATYVPTPSITMPMSLVNQANTDVLHDKKNLAFIAKMMPYLTDRSFEGLGYLYLSANVVDPDSIVKIIDKRYHTVSIGYDTNSVHCSICYQDILADGPCEHKRGRKYGKNMAFWIFGDMTYGEVSYINEPADDLAANIEFDSLSVNSTQKIKNLQSASKDLLLSTFKADSLHIISPERVCSSDCSIYMTDSKSQEIISITSFEDTNEMNILKITELGADAYEQLFPYLPEDKRLTKENLDALKAEDFLGDTKLPVVDLVHIEAIKKLFTTCTDDALIDTYNEYLTSRVDLLAANENPVTDPVPDPKPATNPEPIVPALNTEETGGNTDPQLTPTPEETTDVTFVIDKANNVVVKEGVVLTAEAKAAIAKLCVASEDMIVKTSDYNTLTNLVDSNKKEFKLTSDGNKALSQANLNLVKKLKDSYIKLILDSKGKQEPDTTMADELQTKSLSELEAFLDIKNTIASKSTDTVTVPVNNHSFTQEPSAMTDSERDTLKLKIENNYVRIRSMHGEKVANNYRTLQLNKLAETENINKE